MTEKTASELLDEHIASIQTPAPAAVSLEDINETLNAILVTLVRILDANYVALSSRDEAGTQAAAALEKEHTEGKIISPVIYIAEEENT